MSNKRNNSLTDKPSKRKRTRAQQEQSARNFEQKGNPNALSLVSQKKIRTCIQWMCMLTARKSVYDKASKQMKPYYVGLCTLSLPTGCENVNPVLFRKVLLPAFISALEYRFDLRHYIWKLERQERGALHAHITLDKFIPYDYINQVWCSILGKHGLLSAYTSYFSSLSLRDYVAERLVLPDHSVQLRKRSCRAVLRSYVKAYKKGISEQWMRPNCTDIHAVLNVKNLAAYLCKYLTKAPALGDEFQGRMWFASRPLSRLRSTEIDAFGPQEQKFLNDLNTSELETSSIFIHSKSTGNALEVATFWLLPQKRSQCFALPFLGSIFAQLKSLYAQCSIPPKPIFELPCL